MPSHTAPALSQLQFPSVGVLSLIQLDVEDPLCSSQLLITVLEGSFLLFEEALDVAGDPGFRPDV